MAAFVIGTVDKETANPRFAAVTNASTQHEPSRFVRIGLERERHRFGRSLRGCRGRDVGRDRFDLGQGLIGISALILPPEGV